MGFFDDGYCIIHKRHSAEMNGERGELIWDYLVWNELTFKSHSGRIIRLHTTTSDYEMEATYNQYVRQYGI